MNQLKQALTLAQAKHGNPSIGHVKRPTGQSFLALSFSDDEIYFMPSYDNFTIYEMRKDGRDIVTHTWRDLGTRSNQVDVMARLVEVRPRCRALEVVQATDAMYTLHFAHQMDTRAMMAGAI